MKLLDTTGKTLKKVKTAAVAVAQAVLTTPPAQRARDPWNRTDARQAALERPRWLRRRRGGWLR